MSESIFKKIKNFFSNIFSSKKLLKEGNVDETKIQENNIESKVATNERKNMFEQANEYANLISLQKMYLQGKIQEKDMTEEQIISLKNLFDTQIENTKRNNENLKRKIIKALVADKELMGFYKRVKNGEIDEKELTKDQVKQIDFLLNVEIEKTKMEIKQLQYKRVQA